MADMVNAKLFGDVLEMRLDRFGKSPDIGEMTFSDESDCSINSAEALILQWGQQVVTLSGQPEFKVELASKRKRRTRAKS